MSELGEILVTPGYLKQRAKDMNDLLKKAFEGYREIKEIADETESCFMGKSGDKMRKHINSAVETGMEQMEILSTFPKKLDQIAEEYNAAERENKDATVGN